MSARPRLSTEWSLAGQPAVILENTVTRVVVLPGLGGKVFSIVDKRVDRELLWRNDRVPLRPAAFGSSYDDQFIGGWDELYPTDVPEELVGEPLPDHGELWAVPWASSTGASADEVWLELRVRGAVTGTEVSKRLTLGTGAELVTDYRITNRGRTDQPFLWKTHVAVALQPDTVVDMAATDVLVHEFGSPRARPADGHITWPWLSADGVRHDLRTLPDATERGVSEFLLATALERGECGVRHPSAGTGLQLTWDRADLASCWLFASYGGGWRGLDVLVLEPCTGYPLSVGEGVEAGTHQVLAAGATKSWQLTARLTQ
ncbi:DUF5107 domain-containing protein [Kribbella turkmenica]|uniref:DUF5107 domain-containing protein n=1 Tax=Kribbella turkmenica TaxID=2530375 RepID=A0A4R4WPZ8_9ACTN|nr:DUF5107 domain-containing protein [Kribbella turkmenica]TDD19504.1 DUF5107 domain-containing protein [Kribbella turkmenica]